MHRKALLPRMQRLSLHPRMAEQSLPVYPLSDPGRRADPPEAPVPFPSQWSHGCVFSVCTGGTGLPMLPAFRPYQWPVSDHPSVFPVPLWSGGLRIRTAFSGRKLITVIGFDTEI